MKAVVATRIGGPEALEVQEIPRPPTQAGTDTVISATVVLFSGTFIARRVLRFSVLVLLLAAAAPAKYIPDPIVRYQIEARLDPAAKTVHGHEVIIWRNHTTDTIPDLQFHLYLKAFKNNYTTYMRE